METQPKDTMETMKNILLKLYNGDNNFVVEFNGEKRNCVITSLNLWGLDEGKGIANVKFDKPIKVMERVEVDRESCWGLDRDDSPPMKDVEVDKYESYFYIGY